MIPDFVPGFGKSTVRKRVDEIFSRHMLGSVLVGVSAGKVVEKILNHFFPTNLGLLVGWTVAFIAFCALFIYWERVAEKAAQVEEQAMGDA